MYLCALICICAMVCMKVKEQLAIVNRLPVYLSQRWTSRLNSGHWAWKSARTSKPSCQPPVILFKTYFICNYGESINFSRRK